MAIGDYIVQWGISESIHSNVKQKKRFEDDFINQMNILC
jgi:hypothetical protein